MDGKVILLIFLENLAWKDHVGKEAFMIMYSEKMKMLEQ